MQTKFRPITTENARKSNSKDGDSSQEFPAKVVRPVAIPVRAKPALAADALPLYTTKNSGIPLFKPIPVVDRVNISFDEKGSHELIGAEVNTFFHQKSSQQNGNVVQEPLKNANRVVRFEAPAAREAFNESDTCKNHETSDANRSKRDFLQDLVEEGRPESGNSQTKIHTSKGRHSEIEREKQLTSISHTSGHLSENESYHPGNPLPEKGIEQGIAWIKNPDLQLDAKPRLRRNDAHLDESFPVRTGTAPNQSKKESDESISPEETMAKNGSSNETPQFSEVIESDDSSRSDPQESLQDTFGSRDSAPPTSSPSSPLAGSDDQIENCSSLKTRKTSNGNRLSPRRMERKNSSTSGSGDGDGNPWFQKRLSCTEEEEDGENSDVENENETLGKGKKTRISRFARIFRSGKNADAGSQDDSMSCSSGDSRSLCASISEDSSVPAHEVYSNQDASEDHLEQTLRLAISGKRKLEEVLDAVLGLSGRPGDKIMKLLTKYMCSNMIIDAAFRLILEHEFTKRADIPLKSLAPSHARYSPHREALIHLFTNGPERLKRALLSHTKARSEILRFFTDARPEGDGEIPYWTSIATSLSKILNGLLAQFPTELSDYIGGKKGVLYLMVKNHIHVPEVVEFVIQLCAANALSKTTGEDLRYGAANAAGLVLLVKEGICGLLVDIFKKSSISTAQGKASILTWQTQVMSTRCLLEMSKRAIVIPRFTKDNCSYSGRYIKTLNSSLDNLSLFTQDTWVLSLLNAGFDAISDGPEIDNVRIQCERNNPLVCALSVIAELLDTVRVAAGSRLAVTRRTVGSANTENIEKHLVSKMARFCKLLHRKSADDVSCRAKVAIVNVIRCLCASKLESTRLSVVKSQIPDRLMILIRENQRSSVLHTCVLKCLSSSFSNPQSVELHNEWLQALARSDGWLQVMYEYFHHVRGADDHGCKPYFSTFVEIGLRLVDFCENDKETKLRPILRTKAELQAYVDCIEAGLLSMRNEYETPCGGPKPTERAVSVLANAETLAARLHDFNAV